MKILVTGSLGTIGASLMPELVRRGHAVWGCDVRHTDADNLYTRCNVACFRQLQSVLWRWKPELVYHCAAEFGRHNGEDFYEQLWMTNVIGTKHLIRMQEMMRFKLVHFSSSEVYGDTSGVMSESNPVPPLLNDYAMTKWVNEQQIANSRKLSQTASVIVRLFNTYGPGEFYTPYRSVNCRFIYNAIRGKDIVVYRGHRRTSTYVSDTVCTLANIAANFVSGQTYNIAGEQEHSIEELAEVAMSCVGRRVKVKIEDPEPMTTTVKQPDISRAKVELGHKPVVSLEDGMLQTALWMMARY